MIHTTTSAPKPSEWPWPDSPSHKPEEVCVITDPELTEFNASACLKDDRLGWAIESGLHQRLDVSHNDDRCRVRHSKSTMVFAGMRRLANSLFMEWRLQFPKPDDNSDSGTGERLDKRPQAA